jgi:hypothetical protein
MMPSSTTPQQQSSPPSSSLGFIDKIMYSFLDTIVLSKIPFPLQDISIGTAAQLFLNGICKSLGRCGVLYAARVREREETPFYIYREATNTTNIKAVLVASFCVNSIVTR